MIIEKGIFESGEIAGVILALMEKHRVPGSSAAFIRRGEIVWSGAFGVRGDGGAPMTEGVLFECASLTKSLFALLAMQEADAGRLDIDAPIAPLIADTAWSDDPRFAKITPRHCLSHGCGLPNWQARPMDMLFEPGTDFSYSGEGYFLLQRLVEQIEGKDMARLFRERIFEPFGMESSFARWTPAVGAAFSAGFSKDGAVNKIRSGSRVSGNAPEPNAAWSLYSYAADYARFLCAMINNRGGLSQEAFGEMTRIQNPAGNGISWGLGFGIPETEPDVMWHWGDNTGFKSFAIWDKATGDGAAVTTNSDNGMAFYMELLKRATDGAFYDDIARFINSAE